MTEQVKVFDQILASSGKYIRPLFLCDYFLQNGFSTETISATATFIHRKGQVYCITCAHVVDELKKLRSKHEKLNGVLSLMFGHGAIQLGKPQQSCFASPTKNLHEEGFDISLAHIPWGCWETLKFLDNKLDFIDLDNFQLPTYSELISCGAIGFPDRLKFNQGRKIKLNTLIIVAGTTRPIKQTDIVFQLHSELSEPHGVGLSGISGGLVVGIVSPSEQVPIGIVFQGSPSGEEENEGSIFGSKDLFLRCNLLNPLRFDDWLERTSFPNIKPEFIGIVY